MGLFGKSIEPPESILTDEEIERRIISDINLLSTRNKDYLISLYFSLMDKVPDQSTYLSICFKNVRRFHSSVCGGFYQLHESVNLPFITGDIVIFSMDRNYEKENILYIMQFDDQKNPEFCNVKYDYTDNDKIIVKSILDSDKAKYSLQPWNIIGRKIYEFKFGTNEWRDFIISSGEDINKILDHIDGQLKYIPTSNLINKDKVIDTLKQRREWIINSIGEK